MCGVLANAGGFVDAAGAISVCDGGERGSNDLLGCSHYLFILFVDGLVVLLNQTYGGAKKASFLSSQSCAAVISNVAKS